MDEYNMCQWMKNRIEVPVERLKLSEAYKKLQIYLMVDFITKLLLVAGKDTILVIYDRLSKMIHFITTTEEILTEGLARLFWDNMQKLYGLSESVVSDRELQFVVELNKELNKMLEIETKLLTSFYPQTNGQIE